MSDITPQSWAQDLLTRMGYPVTQNNMTSVLAWEYQEGGHFSNAATFNPLNSTLGHATYGSMNSVGVSTYPDYETGMKETIRTINLHYYDKIRSDLQASADPSTTTADIKSSPWGTWHGGASTKGALGRAGQTVAAHPVTAVPTTPTHPATPAPAVPSHPATAAPATAAPATTAPATTAPATGSVAPVVAGAAAGTAVGSSTATGSGSGSFEGADVDGLDTLAREFTQAAQIVDEVKTACEVIVAAASMFGPFGAAFVAYLKGTVIPWLTRISQALTAMSKVLSLHSQAQKDASSTATSLPSYTSPGGANPTTSTQDFPLIGAVTGALGALAVAGPAATTALPALIGAVAGSSTSADATAGKAGGEQPESPERVAPHDVEASKNFGRIMNRDVLADVEHEELGVDKPSAVHLTSTIAQADGDVSALSLKTDHVDAALLHAKAGGAVFGGIDPKDGGQLGVAGVASANLADVKVHTDIPLGGSSALKLSDETSLGATAGGQAVAGYNPLTGTVSANAGGEVFAGLRTTATVTEVTPYVTNTTELTGQFGAGAAANAALTIGGGHLSAHAGLGAAFGLGGKISDNIDVSYQRIADDAYTGATNVYNEASTTISGAATEAGTYLDSWFTPAPRTGR